MEILYHDKHICVCIKPAGVLSTDEEGGMPTLVRKALKGGDARTVHRLDRVVGGVMVLARTPNAASELSRQIRENQFGKTYLAVVHGSLPDKEGQWTDLLLRNLPERKTYIVSEPQKGAQEARLDYRVLGRTADMTLVRITLHTGRTHQIRAQFSGRGFPLVGDKKYGISEETDCEIALWSNSITFTHPSTGKKMNFTRRPPAQYPWTLFRGEQ